MGNALIVMVVPEETFMGPGPHKVTVGQGDVWRPPVEPHGLGWHRDPQLRKEHRQAVRDSLESFLNGKLAGLYWMVRTGWWVLGEARVKVTRCAPVPEKKMKAFLGGLKRARGRGNASSSR